MTNEQIRNKINILFDKVDSIHEDIDILIEKLEEQGEEY